MMTLAVSDKCIPEWLSISRSLQDWRLLYWEAACLVWSSESCITAARCSCARVVHWKVKPCTHWQQSWIQHGRLWWTGNKSTTKSKVQRSWTFNFLTNTFNCDIIISNKVERRWTINFVADLLPVQQSRPRWIQLCCQCVPGCKVTGNLTDVWQQVFE